MAIVIVLAATVAPAAAAAIEFPAEAVRDPVALSTTMPQVADALLASYAERDEKRRLDTTFRLQIVAGRYDAARATIASLRGLHWPGEPDAGAAYLAHLIFLNARASEAATGDAFDVAFTRSFHETVDSLDDRTAAIVERAFTLSPAGFRDTLQRALARQRGKTEITPADASALVRVFEEEELVRLSASVVAPLIAQDDQRRYVVQIDLQVATGDGGTICAFVARPRTASHLPTLLQFTIYADRAAYLNEARQTASNGYVSVIGFTRGKACSPDTIEPYEHDGADAAALIAWIARQPWSDGRVGMYGGSYNSFAQWAAVKHMPPALKAIMPSVPNAPGIDTPMERNVFQSFSYPWPPYVTAGKWLDANSEGDPSHFIALENRWYSSGRPYRDMPQMDGVPNPIWSKWLDHPSYDAFWQRYIPYKEEFARVNIPSLTTDGYLAGQDVGGLYYFQQYAKYRPDAQNYLVIGPYDHIRGQRGTVTSLDGDIDSVVGYTIDPAAHIDIAALRYQWFDYIFKGAPRPGILQNRVNYEVMGANVWKHAPSIAAMHNHTVRLYLSSARRAGFHDLARNKPTDEAAVAQTVKLADRSDVDRVPPATGLDTYLSVAYESAPFDRAFDLSGLFAAHLDVVTNKRDFDFNMSLYQLTPTGRYVAITYYQGRASYVPDAGKRELLVPGRRKALDFSASRLTSWYFPKGSRLVVLLGVVKEPDVQVNMGSGRDVSDESTADARAPLRLRWFDDSFIDVPVGN